MKNSVKSLDTSLIEEFASQLRGEIVKPSDADYNETRKVYNWETAGPSAIANASGDHKERSR